MGIDRNVWECYSDKSFDEDEEFDGGCSGWGRNTTVEKWLNDVPVKVWATGDSRYIELFEDSLDYLAPILNLDFQWVETERDADFKAYVGILRTEAASYDFDRLGKFYVVDAGGFAGSTALRGEVTSAYIVVWALDDPEWDARQRDRVTSITVHEVIHAMAAINHSSRPLSIVGGSGLKWLSPMDEALVRLNSHDSVEPGMTMDEVESLLVFSDDLPDEAQSPEPSTTEMVWRATTKLVEAGSARFKMRGGWTENRCNLLFGVRRGLATYETVFETLRQEPPIVHFDDQTTNFYIILDDVAREWTHWLNVRGDWQMVDRETLTDSTYWWMWNGKLTSTLRSLLNDAAPEDISVVDRSNGTITLEATLDESYPTFWSRSSFEGGTVGFRIVLDDESFALKGYTWRRSRQPSDSCYIYEEEVSEVELGVEVEVPESIRELMSQ